MFSMFFGSGNIVFPVLIGSEAQSSFLFAILGFIATGVCLPFLGLVGIMQFQGNRQKYFELLTPIPAFLLTLVMLLLMGPAGIIPRCASVSFGGFIAMVPSCPQWLFNALFCLIIAGLIWKKNRIIEIIGIYLTPIKLGSFILLIIVGLYFASWKLGVGKAPLECFSKGLTSGYQTMDLVASFFFGSAIYEYIKIRVESKMKASGQSVDDQTLQKNLLSLGIKASLVGGFSLSLCYVGFVLLGAEYASILTNVAPESFLMVIANHTMGALSVPFIGITLIVSCLATATITASIFADFLKEDVLRNMLSREICIIITLLMAYTLSLLGFKGICDFLGAILTWVYPFLMCYAVFQMMRYFKKKN